MEIMRIPPREQAVQGFPVNRSYTRAESDNRYALKGGTGTLTLQTNGANNGSQSLLNIKNGTGITVVDDGSGGVTITATGGGTGTVTSVTSADANATVASTTTTPVITIVAAPKWATARNLAGNSVDGSANVVFANKFIVQGTTDAGLSSAQFLGALATGIVKNTTSTGVLSIAVAGDFPTLNQSTSGNAATATALATGRTISITGDIAYTSPSFDGSGNVTAAGTLATVNTNVGSFGSATQVGTFTVNGKGLVTAAGNTTITPAIGSITGLGTGIATFLATPSSANLASAMTDETGSGALVFSISPTLTTAILGSSTATTQPPADNSTKIATTAYVDAAVLGQNFKEACLVATTANLVGVYLSGTFTYTATGTDNIDGVNLALGNRVLVKNQTTTFQNGIYTVTTAGSLGVAGILTRATDANSSGEFKTGDSAFVTSGTVNTSTTWAYTGVDSPTIGTDAITYAQTAGQGTVTAGNGITITGLSVAIDTSVTVDKTTAQTLTNKTLTAPIMTAPVLGTPASGNLSNCTNITPTSYTGLVEMIGVDDINSSIGNNTYTLVLYAEYGFTINELKIISASGTCTAAVKINGTNVTSISAVSVSSSIATGTASGANTVIAGDKITLVLSSTSSLTNLQATLKITRT